MKFVTREKPKVDRVACPWLIKKFIDPHAELLFVPADEIQAVAQRENALPYDVPGVELGHKDGASSFEAFIHQYNLTDPALLELAKMVRAADTDDTTAAPEGEGIRQIANGWHLLDWSLEKRLEFGFALYDCLYAVCRKRRTVLFLCPHNAAKSVIAAAYFQQCAANFYADSAGTQPSESVSIPVAEMLKAEGIDVSSYQPRHVTKEELTAVAYVVSMGCERHELPVIPANFEIWHDVPLASQDLPGVQSVLRTRTQALAEKLKGI
jgi:hypothetical protein